MSETALAKPVLSRFIEGPRILDIGFGGTACHPDALTMDMPVGYCPSLEGHPQLFQGDCRDLSFLCNETMSTVWSSHLIEDFPMDEQVEIIKEWRRVLKTGGILITVAPDQPVYKKHCEVSNQPYNEAHRQPSNSLSTFMEVANKAGAWEEIYSNPLVNTYSFHSVLRKL